jgi:hypothetical protein
MPKIDVGIGKCNAHEPSLALLSQRGDNTVDRMGGVLIENLDDLSRDQRGIHEEKSSIGTDYVGGSAEVNRLAFRKTTPDSDGYLQGKAHSAPTLGISGALHKATLGEHLRLRQRILSRSEAKNKCFDTAALRVVWLGGVSWMNWAQAILLLVLGPGLTPGASWK